MARLKAAHPISDEDTEALPVHDLDGAIEFYQTILGFSQISRDSATAVLARDEVQIGLLLNKEHKPGKAGSLAVEVDDLEAMHRELQAKGGNPGKFGID